MFDGKEQQQKDSSMTGSEMLEEAFDRSAHELQLLANFYHRHSLPERAQEIYRTIVQIRRDRAKGHAS